MVFQAKVPVVRGSPGRGRMRSGYPREWYAKRGGDPHTTTNNKKGHRERWERSSTSVHGPAIPVSRVARNRKKRRSRRRELSDKIRPVRGRARSFLVQGPILA